MNFLEKTGQKKEMIKNIYTVKEAGKILSKKLGPTKRTQTTTKKGPRKSFFKAKMKKVVTLMESQKVIR